MSLELALPASSWLGEMIIHEVPFYGPDARLARSIALNGAGGSRSVNRGFSRISRTRRWRKNDALQSQNN